MSSRAAQLLAYLGALPPDVNKYLAAADAIKTSIEPAKGPLWLPKMVKVLLALYGVQLIAAIVACVMLVKVADGRFWLFRRGREGVWTPNTQIFYCILSAIFCAVNVGTLTWQMAIDQGWLSSYRNLILLDSTRWIPLYFAAFIFMFGLVAQTVSLHSDATRSYQTDDDAAWRRQSASPSKRGTRWMAPLVNFLGLLWVVACIVSIFTIFGLANTHLNKAITIQEEVCNSLKAAAPSYDPATFRMTQILPLISPASGMVAPAERFEHLVRVGWITWCCWISLLTIVFTPFLLKHLSVLRRIGAPSLLQCCCRKRQASRRISMYDVDAVPKAGYSASGPSSASTGSVSKFATPIGSPQMEPPQPNLTQDSEKISQPKVMSGSYKLAGSLALSALVIYAAGIVYIPLTVWAAATTLQNEDFWIGQLVLGSGSYAIFGLLIHFVVIYRCSVVLRSRNGTASSAAHSSLQGRLSGSRRPGRNPRTLAEDSHFVSRGVWIETYVEVDEEHALGLKEMDGHQASTGSATAQSAVPWAAPWQNGSAIPITMNRDREEDEKDGRV